MFVAVMLDALNYNYLKYEAPFINELSKEGLHAELIPSFGFEPDAAYVAGLYPEECDGGMHYWHDEPGSPFRWTRSWTWALAFLPQVAQHPIRRFIQVVNLGKEQELGRKYLSSPARIPLNKLHYFGVAHSKLMFQPGFTTTPTIFDLLSSHGRRWAYFGHPIWRGGISQIYQKLLKQDLEDLDFAFIMVGDLDLAGHAYGTAAEEIREAVKKVDTYLGKIFELFAQLHRDSAIIVFGDHGMVDVATHIDIQGKLGGLKAQAWMDYDYFLDSTLARFWFHTERGREEVLAILSDLPGGSMFSDEDRVTYRARYPHNKFGEVIFWADGGRVLLPNFFQGEREVKGMHGYRREVRDNHSGMILFDPRRKMPVVLNGPVDMVRLFPTFLQLLDLPAGYGRGIPSLLH